MDCDIGNDVALAADLLVAGQLVAFPTETVYGLGANALDAQAVARLFAAKCRPRFDPLIVHVANVAAARQLVTAFGPLAVTLAEHFWPGPLTLVLPKVERIPDLVTAGLPTVAIRVPDHPLAQSLLQHCRLPIAAPSANLFGRVSPTTAAHVAEQLGDRIAYVLDGGPCRVGVESTVLHLAREHPTLLRPGGASCEELEAVIGAVSFHESNIHPDDRPQPSPGLMDRHYAPRTPLRIVDELPEPPARPSRGLLTLQPCEGMGDFDAVEVLSDAGDLTEAAANFYAALRRLDAAGVSQILSRRFPDHGLGRALNDRLRRAALDG